MKRRNLSENNTMKRLVLSLTLVFALAMAGQAQIFILSDEDNERIGNGELTLNVPEHFVDYDQEEETEYVPLGSGLLALTGMGFGYLLAKKRKEDR